MTQCYRHHGLSRESDNQKFTRMCKYSIISKKIAQNSEKKYYWKCLWYLYEANANI